jgi:hypothetical protein
MIDATSSKQAAIISIDPVTPAHSNRQTPMQRNTHANQF